MLTIAGILGPLWLYLPHTGLIYDGKFVRDVLGHQGVLVQAIVVDEDFEFVDALITTGGRHAISTLCGAQHNRNDMVKLLKSFLTLLLGRDYLLKIELLYVPEMLFLGRIDLWKNYWSLHRLTILKEILYHNILASY